MAHEPHVRGRATFGDIVRLYGYPGVFEVWATPSERYDFHAKPIGDPEREQNSGFPAMDSGIVEINGRAVPLLSCPIARPAADYPHLPLFDYTDGPVINAIHAVDAWRRP